MQNDNKLSKLSKLVINAILAMKRPPLAKWEVAASTGIPQELARGLIGTSVYLN